MKEYVSWKVTKWHNGFPLTSREFESRKAAEEFSRKVYDTTKYTTTIEQAVRTKANGIL